MLLLPPPIFREDYSFRFRSPVFPFPSLSSVAHHDSRPIRSVYPDSFPVVDFEPRITHNFYLPKVPIIFIPLIRQMTTVHVPMIANNFWRLFPKINPLMTRVSWAALSSSNSGGAGTSSTPYFKPTQPIIWEDFFGESQQERRDKAAFLQCIGISKF
jgi:hypothetical protein